MNDLPVIFADFNNVDPDGRLRLNCVGTVNDLARLGLVLAQGTRYVFTDGELSVEGRAVLSPEGIWAAEIVWDDVKNGELGSGVNS